MRADRRRPGASLWDRRVGKRYIFYIIWLETAPSAGQTKEHSLGRLAYYPHTQKRGVKEECLSVLSSAKERIPNLPKSSANPVSPCALILSILDMRSRRKMDPAGEALGREPFAPF